MSWLEPRKDGDGGFLLLTRGGYPFLQYIPGDLIRNPYKGFDFHTMFDGVECDPPAARCGSGSATWTRGARTTSRTSTPSDFVYLAHRDSPLAARGVDGLQHDLPAARPARLLYRLGYQGRDHGLHLRPDRSGATGRPSVLNQLGTTENSAGVQQKAITLDKGGMLKVLGTAESVFQVQAQQPMTQTPDFIRAMLRLTCLAFDMPLEIGNKDLSQVNFSGGRIG
jgi:hypothetical protein